MNTISMNEITLSNGKKVYFKVVSVRRFSIETDHPEIIIERDEQGEFVSLSFSELYTIRKDEEFLIKSSEDKLISYILRDVAKVSPGVYHGIDQKLTKTCMFILPLLLNDYDFFDYNYSLYNCYLATDHKHIYLKYKFIDSEKFLKLEDKLRGHPLFIKSFDPDKQFVVYIFKLQERYKNFISQILEGKYSQVSEYYKNTILKFHKAQKGSTIGMILYKDSIYKHKLEKDLGAKIPDNIDLMSKSQEKEELWIYQNISQKIGTVY